jgi:hypothetical protein
VNRFDASTPAADGPGPASLLAGLRGRQVERDLDDVLARFDDLEARLAEREAEEELDPEVVGALEAVTGADDAPLTFRSLHERVHRGVLTWQQFWADPSAESDGMAVIHAAMRERLAADALVAERPDPS